MGLEDALKLAHGALERRGIDHALMGGLALAALGIARATFDVDLLVDGERREDAREALVRAGFSVFHETEEVIQLAGPAALDCLLAKRPPTRAMLGDALVLPGLGLKCLRAEDLIGLKIQAYVNDRSRELRDKADIQSIARARPDLDRARVRQYAEIFDEWSAIESLVESP